MIDDGAPHPVELLRDRHGVYGIGACGSRTCGSVGNQIPIQLDLEVNVQNFSTGR